jgi:LDH2 family malate/lactate/ureidoglycolate dehydrogenase
VVIRRSHHIGCLQAYLKSITDAGLVGLLLTSDPAGGGVAPHGGVASRITPNPLAMGFPTGPDPSAAPGASHPDPVLIDVSMSTSTNAIARARRPTIPRGSAGISAAPCCRSAASTSGTRASRWR